MTSAHPPLRPIAIHVEEAEEGDFFWVLIERSRGDTWKEIERAGEPVATFKTAMADGLIALQAMTDNLDVGPRVPSPKAGKADTAAEEDEGEPAKPARKSMFGFGPAR
jgi:hypothetical protein